MKKKRLVIVRYILFMFLMIVIFVNLDNMVGALFKTKTNDLQRVDFDWYESMAKDPVYYTINFWAVEDNDFETVIIDGTCAVNTEMENSKKTVSILFKSENNCYVSERASRLGDPPANASHALGINAGFYHNISTLPLKNGTYELYLFVKENEENYGLVDLNRGIVKDQGGVRLKERAVTLNIEPNELYTDARIDLGVIAADEQTVTIEGWAFLEDMETEGQKIYLKLSTVKETRYVECDNVYRPDVSVVFGNSKYDYSGVKGYTDRQWIGDGPLEIYAIIENELGFFTGSKHYRWDPDDGSEVTIGETELRSRPEPLIDTIGFDLENVQQTVHSYLDTVKEQDGIVWIGGWIAAENQETLGQQVFIEIQGGDVPLYAECTPESREDIGIVLGNTMYVNSGYTGRIAVQDLPKNGFSFCILMKNDTGVYTDGEVHHFDFATGEFT